MSSQIYAQRRREESSQMHTIGYKGGGGQGCIRAQKKLFWTAKSQNISFFCIKGRLEVEYVESTYA